MTALYCYDGAYDRNLLAQCKAHGAVAMSHYMTRSYASTSAQPDAVRAAGMGVVFNWEGFAAELVGETRAQGFADGTEALRAYPANAPKDGTTKIYYSVDTDLTDFAVVAEAFRGINDAHSGTNVQVGVYGEAGLIRYLYGLGLVQGGQWLSMSEAFSGHPAYVSILASGLVAMVQQHTAAGTWLPTPVPNTDINTILDPHALGAWWPTGSPYEGTTDMPLTDADVQRVADAVWAKQFADRADPTGKTTYTAGQLLYWANRFGLAASKTQQVAVDAAAVAADITGKVRSSLSALFTGPQA